MSRRRFRSQPTLRRSGGRTPSAILAFSLAAVIGVGAGGLVGVFLRGLEDSSQRPAAERTAERPPVTAPTAPAGPQLIAQAIPEPSAAPARTVKAALAPPPNKSRPAKPAKIAPPELAAPEPDWQQQQREYEVARDAYDANERSEGFRWAQRNRIRVHRYCRAAEQRTAAFVQGCMNYVGSRRATEPDKPRA